MAYVGLHHCKHGIYDNDKDGLHCCFDTYMYTGTKTNRIRSSELDIPDVKYCHASALKVKVCRFQHILCHRDRELWPFISTITLANMQ